MKLPKIEITELFEGFKDKTALVIGDVMIDAYYWGKVDRISPEAPVPIVAVNKQESRMGGAANVALNIQALGAKPILCSIIGSDEDGNTFLKLLNENKQSNKGIIRSEKRKTTSKSRVIGNNHQMLRIDSEQTDPITEDLSNLLYSRIEGIIEEENIDVIIFEDYDKGLITPFLIEKVVELARANNIPTTVDPKLINFMNYKGVSLFKPNLKELKEGLKIQFDATNLDELKAAILKLEEALQNESTLITLSENGVYINTQNASHHIHAHRRDITDVSGAGDTVISVASLCLASKCKAELIAELSNLAGGLVCENVGVVPISKETLKEEAERLFT